MTQLLTKKIDVFNDAQDFTVIGKSETNKDSYIYAVKPSLETMGHFYAQTIAHREDFDFHFNTYWRFDKEEGIKGSSFYLALRFDKTALRSNGLWLPGLLEAKVLDKLGKLENGVYRDFGIVLYNEKEPTQEMAQSLVSQAKSINLQLPLIVPFKALDYDTNKNKVNVSLVNPQGIIHGKEAQKQIYSFGYQIDSGVRRLGRGGAGDWDVDWGGLAGSDGGGRVDWICGEESREVLREAHKLLVTRKYGVKIKVLEDKRYEEENNFEKSLQ